MTARLATVLLCAGGTGGHLFPAESLAHALRARGIRVALASDARVDSLSADFPASEIASIPSATPSGRNLVRRGLAAQLLGVPTLIHEQNAVMGRANGFLAPRARAIATARPIRRSARAIPSAFSCSAAARARGSCPRSYRRP